MPRGRLATALSNSTFIVAHGHAMGDDAGPLSPEPTCEHRLGEHQDNHCGDPHAQPNPVTSTVPTVANNLLAIATEIWMHSDAPANQHHVRNGWGSRTVHCQQITGGDASGFCLQSTAVEITSLGYQTDLALLRLGGAQIEDREDHLVIRSPNNPGHWWGNFLLLSQVPAPEASQSWLDRFTAAFPEAQHIALGFDRMHGTITELGWFARQGFTAEAQTVMTASKIHQPARRNTDAVYRRLHSDADWAQSVTLRLRCNEGTYEPRAYHSYVAARVQTYRDLVETGHGGWFGAFIDGRLVSQMGLFIVCSDFARFQVVETDPDYRRRALAVSLVHHVGGYGLTELAARTLVIVADPNYFAINLYRAVGFTPTQTQLQIGRRPSRD